MTTSGAIAVAVMSVFFFYVCGALCIFKTNMLRRMGAEKLYKEQVCSSLSVLRYGHEALVSNLHS